MPMCRFPRPAELTLAAAALLSACATDTLVAPIVPVTRTITVDASTAYAYLALDTISQVVTVASPSGSTVWDIGFFATGVTTNGGAASAGSAFFSPPASATEVTL